MKPRTMGGFKPATVVGAVVGAVTGGAVVGVVAGGAVVGVVAGGAVVGVVAGGAVVGVVAGGAVVGVVAGGAVVCGGCRRCRWWVWLPAVRWWVWLPAVRWWVWLPAVRWWVWLLLGGDCEVRSTAGGGAVRPRQYDLDAVRSIGELLRVVRNRCASAAVPAKSKVASCRFERVASSASGRPDRNRPCQGSPSPSQRHRSVPSPSSRRGAPHSTDPNSS